MMLSTLLAVASIVLAALLTYTQLKLSKVKKSLRKYDTILSKEEFEKQLDSNINLKQTELDQIVSEQQKLNAQTQKSSKNSMKFKKQN
jgi:Flp pilus assembly protein TadB